MAEVHYCSHCVVVGLDDGHAVVVDIEGTMAVVDIDAAVDEIEAEAVHDEEHSAVDWEEEDHNSWDDIPVEEGTAVAVAVAENGAAEEDHDHVP